MGHHDALFKRALSLPENAAGELRAVLPPALARTIDLDALTLVPASFVDATLSHRHADLLFRTTLRSGKTAFVYFLIEHQSEPDPLMPLRLLAYLVRIWEAYVRESGSNVLPPIFPVVVHHGEQGWTAPTRLRDMIEGYDELGADADRIPDFRLTIDDLIHRTNAELLSRPLGAFGRVTLWILRDGRSAVRLVANLREWIGPLASLANDPDKDELRSVMGYIYGVAGRDTYDDVAAALRTVPEAERSMQTIEEWLIEKGIAQGRIEGQLQGKRDMLRAAFEAKLGAVPESVGRIIDQANAPELDALLQRIIGATSIDDVL